MEAGGSRTETESTFRPLSNTSPPNPQRQGLLEGSGRLTRKPTEVSWASQANAVDLGVWGLHPWLPLTALQPRVRSSWQHTCSVPGPVLDPMGPRVG